jgi:hypothetical protein
MTTPNQRKPTIHEAILANTRSLKSQLAPLASLAQSAMNPNQPSPTDLMLDLLQQILTAIEQLRQENEVRAAKADDAAIAAAIKQVLQP